MPGQLATDISYPHALPYVAAMNVRRAYTNDWVRYRPIDDMSFVASGIWNLLGCIGVVSLAVLQPELIVARLHLLLELLQDGAIGCREEDLGCRVLFNPGYSGTGLARLVASTLLPREDKVCPCLR